MGIPHCYYQMGIFLSQGIGVKQDKKAALAYFHRSADLGSPYGRLVSGEELLTAFSGEPEPIRSKGKALGKKFTCPRCFRGRARTWHGLFADRKRREYSP
ncbi:hypothetical protein [Serratia marcescens]|uniref:hypothetical protein n=1 Tax=Serratia marcescens TaxID=615 RepID=UPI003CC82BAD